MNGNLAKIILFFSRQENFLRFYVCKKPTANRNTLKLLSKVMPRAKRRCTCVCRSEFFCEFHFQLTNIGAYILSSVTSLCYLLLPHIHLTAVITVFYLSHCFFFQLSNAIRNVNLSHRILCLCMFREGLPAMYIFRFSSIQWWFISQVFLKEWCKWYFRAQAVRKKWP